MTKYDVFFNFGIKQLSNIQKNTLRIDTKYIYGSLAIYCYIIYIS